MNLSKLIAQAAGGRVIRTNFLDIEEIDRRALNAPEVKYLLAGGFPDAGRVVLTLFPDHIPSVSDPVEVLRLEGAFPATWDATDVLIALKRAGLEGDQIGDVRASQGGFLVALTGQARERALQMHELAGFEVHAEPAAAASVARPPKTREVVVPSMRVDVVGAKGFGVSRAYFQAGLENGKVRLNGQPARSSSEIREGDSLSAEGLGRIEFKRVVSETRRGNYKLELEIFR
ncbi:RNA-binding protein YlmH [Deinobacterium chartae]|uniref:RNA-binding protein YlmH n=1 Tax=Deinobacterium chartae TaxID=521158 RepID=A0A841I165_9DEIO|nr:S4 domain-containing protein [Deinobacterium chartae]MBB6097822.1 RNA-binding protein YlmH [Deinobacterium chartae]